MTQNLRLGTTIGHLGLLISLLSGACSTNAILEGATKRAAHTGPTVTAGMTVPPTPTSSVTQRPGNMPSGNLPPLPLAILPPQDYVVYTEPSDHIDASGADVYNLIAASPDGTFTRNLGQVQGAVASLSPRRDRLAILGDVTLGAGQFVLRIIDLSTGDVSTPAIEPGILAVVWSPDENGLLLSRPRGVLEFLSLATESSVPIMDCAAFQGPGTDCVATATSSDGRWFALWIGKSASGEQGASNGTYLLDTTCLSVPSTCLASLSGPVAKDGIAAWSPKGDLVASVNRGKVIVLDSTSWKPVTTLSVRQGTLVNSLVWSPAGDALAFSTGSAIYVGRISSGQVSILIGDSLAKRVAFWTQVP
jgi:WD40 repeat protein